MIPRFILSLGAVLPLALITEDFKIRGAANTAVVVVVRNFLLVKEVFLSLVVMIYKVLWI
jgi:hypothetical protein